jgi:hypothetical protein
VNILCYNGLDEERRVRSSRDLLTELLTTLLGIIGYFGKPTATKKPANYLICRLLPFFVIESCDPAGIIFIA